MSTIFQKFQKRNFFPAMPAKDDLPISHTNPHDKIGIRRRLSSFSVKIQPLSSPTTSTWAFRRSKSMSSIGEFAGGSLRKWWDWGFGWILSRKPTFARDLEMNEEETAMLGFHTKGSWRHVLFKVKSELRRVIGSQSIPSTQGFRYDSFSYEQNFDDGRKKSAED